jgi:hypothetical protein
LRRQDQTYARKVKIVSLLKGTLKCEKIHPY